MKILIVENDEMLTEEIQHFLSGEACGSDIIRSPMAALQAIAANFYDIILFNISSLNREELDLLRFLKTSRLSEKTILTYQPGEVVSTFKVESLGMCNIPKPYTLPLLQAMFHTIYRFDTDGTRDKLFFKELMIDVPGRSVQVKDLPVYLTRREFDLLHLFVANKTKVLSKSNLALYIAKSAESAESEPTDYGFLYAHIKNLKKKLKSAGCQDYIQTVYGIGYRFHES